MCGNRFRSTSTISPKWDACDECKVSQPPCQCGCGKTPRSPRAKYCPGHAPKDTTSPQNIAGHRRQAAKMVGRKPSIVTRAKLSFNHGKLSWKQTSPERMLFDALDPIHFAYTGTHKSLPGVPISADILCVDKRIIVQMDGCYWHECPLHGSNKFHHKKAADAALTAYAESEGWVVLRFWEHEVKKTLPSVVSAIQLAYASCKVLR